MAAPICPACGTAARLTNGAEIYPHRADLFENRIWKCDVCPDAYVRCHEGTEDALGTPAGPELRNARRMLHRDMLDPIWMGADRCADYRPDNEKARTVIRMTARRRVYAYLAAGLELDVADCHVAMFTLEQCREAWHCLRGVTYPEIRAWAKAKPAKPKKEKRAKKLPAPTQEERDAARVSARLIKSAIMHPEEMGEPFTAHLDLSNPRRGLWITTWANLPGLCRTNGLYSHELLPGWVYKPAEVLAEMVPDLEALAERGVRPTQATNQEVAA
ncbi:zinc-finger-containing protein [uncultured Methylobacterium sp.]|uniref:zinc-finger-containing protein n=1 Tax=uncultured Methylobacterium sp. TaxID=157278 RepID=UPI0035CBBF52